MFLLSKISMKKSLSIKGVINLDENPATVEIEGYEKPVVLKDIMQDFNGQEVSISANTVDELA